MALMPQEMITRIGRAYLLGQEWMQRNGLTDEESIDVALSAETYRWFWKPHQVKTVLFTSLRERTTPQELLIRVKTQWLTCEGHKSPDSFVRAPYCLGYGEPDIVNGTPSDPGGSSVAFWNVLAKLAERPEYDAQASLLDRLESKARILLGLHERGIWLIDSTLHGDRHDRDLIKIRWQTIGMSHYEDLAKPIIVAYGRSLYDDLLAVGVPVSDWLYHPQGLVQPQQKQHQERALERLLRLSANG